MSFHRHKGHLREEDNIDDWLMTYADMITLLLCFFAVLLSLSVPKKDQFDKAKAEMTKKFSGAKPKAGDLTSGAPEGTTGKPFISAQSFMEQYAPQQQEVTPDQRDRLTVIEMNSSAFFARGAASLSDEGRTILLDVANRLKGDQYKNYKVTVEGHTDDIPISTPQFPSNWELSTARAAAVVRYFIEQGVPVQRLRASGYADSMPKVPNRDSTGVAIPENQAQNRRVVIKLEKIEKAEQ
jgi:chemotaxis protein MotB